MRRAVIPASSRLIAASLRRQPGSRQRGALVKALARAWRWQRLLDDWPVRLVSDIGDAENISKSYVSRILRLALLSPDTIEAILAGSTDQDLILEQLARAARSHPRAQGLVSQTRGEVPLTLRFRAD